MIKGKQDKIFNGEHGKTNPWLDGNTTALRLEDPVRVWEGYWGARKLQSRISSVW